MLPFEKGDTVPDITTDLTRNPRGEPIRHAGWSVRRGSAFRQGAEAASTIGCILRALADLSIAAKALRLSSDGRSAMPLA
jgi:hypothetical protein